MHELLLLLLTYALLEFRRNVHERIDIRLAQMTALRQLLVGDDCHYCQRSTPSFYQRINLRLVEVVFLEKQPDVTAQNEGQVQTRSSTDMGSKIARQMCTSVVAVTKSTFHRVLSTTPTTYLPS